MEMECPFCQPDFTQFGSIDRKFYEDPYTLAMLSKGQDSRGYSLVVLKPHRADLSISLYPTERLYLMRTLNMIAARLKSKLGAKRIYVVSMCDGVEHLHFHLIPRYEWTDADKQRYRELFTERDGIESVNRQIEKNQIGGSWWLAEIERHPMILNPNEEYFKKLLKELI